MRKLAIVLGIIFAVLMAAVLISWATFDVNRYRGRIQAELETRLGRKVTLGQMHLSLAPPSFQVENLAIADDQEVANPRPFVQADRLSVSVKLLPLLQSSVEINSLDLRHPTVELVKDRNGAWNFSSLGESPQAGKAAPAGEPVGSNRQFSLSSLTIRDGQVALTDRQNKKSRTVYSHIDLTAENLAAGQPFQVQLAAHLPGLGKQEIRLQGEGGPLLLAALAATPFHGNLNLDGAELSALLQFLNNPALANTDGILSGQSKIDSDSGKLAASGEMRIQNARVHGVDVGYPITAQYDLSDDLQSEVMTIRNTTLKLGSTPLSLSGTVNSKTTPAVVNLNLKASDVSIAEAARLAAALGVAFAPGATVNGRISADIQAHGAIDKPALSGTVSARDVQVTGKDIAQPVQVKSVNLKLAPNEIRSDNFDVISGGTAVTTSIALQQCNSRTPLLAATAQAPNAQLPAVLAMAKAWGVTALDKISGLGALNLNLRATGPVQALTSDQILKALNGSLNVNFNSVRVRGTDVSYQLALLAGFLKPGQNDQGFTNISRLAGNIVVTNGVAQTNDLQALLEIGNMGITGAANLATQALALRATAVLSKTTSQRVGGTAIGGYMNTALANSRGEIVIPVFVTGTFQNPKYAPDFQKLTQMRLKGALPSFENPEGAVSGILGGLLGQKNKDQNQQQHAQPQDTVQQLLDIFGGKKQPQKPPNPPNPPN